MGLLTPDPGLVFWSALTFGLLVFILKRYAWKPILHAVKSREETIEYALAAAKKAKAEVEDLNATKVQIMNDAKAERDTLIKAARELKQSMLDDAKSKAQDEADKIIASARVQIEREKNEAILQLKEKVAEFSVDIAGKLLEEELESTDKQKAIIDKYLQEVNFN
ncbi:F0F1 ATP synthase subunit B [Carboxylicivirga sp. M1479]|uniref:F0F1 ATP synthase subunit B n=1 Tax=Carboxylicivirga sp. M1479 TaxID=2594476 RepID=UPI0011777E6E|nr:F0F1 ATP synthase subunit B [Carboxylicivirga sp. M1479]TRX71225.1 F0F1 ATP synthase subunit B [Carboxylicivirga sp. M1479]